MKNHHHDGHQIQTTRSQIHEAIATRAYELWLDSGKRENQADEHWLEAECELVTGWKNSQFNPALPLAFD